MLLADLIREIDTTSQDFKKNVHTLCREDRKRKLTKISESYQKAREYSDNKVQIAVQMYEMVSEDFLPLHGGVHNCHVCVCVFLTCVCFVWDVLLFEPLV